MLGLLSTQQSHSEKSTYTFKKEFARSLQEHQFLTGVLA